MSSASLTVPELHVLYILQKKQVHRVVGLRLTKEIVASRTRLTWNMTGGARQTCGSSSCLDLTSNPWYCALQPSISLKLYNINFLNLGSIAGSGL